MAEQYQNLGITTTTATIDSSTNPFNVLVTSVSSFPSTFPFRITITDSAGTNAEPMLVTGITASTMTAYRGTAISTYAAAEVPIPILTTHSSGSTVSHNLTAGAMNQIRSDIDQYNSIANRPSSAQVGDRYIGSDSRYDFYRYNGTLWQPFIGSTVITPPPGTTTFTNSGNTVTVTTYGDGAFLMSNASSSSISEYINTNTLPGTYTITGVFISGGVNANFTSQGICLFDGTKIVSFGVAINSSFPGGVWTIDQWNNFSSHNGNYTAAGPASAGVPLWVQIVVTTSSRTFNSSYNGKDWYQQAQVSNTDFLTPTNWGFHMENSSGHNTQLIVLGGVQT